MGIQEIIVIILIGGALLYTIYGIINIFSQKPTSGGCACSSCDIKSGNKELQALIHKKVKKEYS